MGTAQLGAVGLGGSIIWTFFSLFNGLMSSANTFVAQDYGAKQYKDIGRIVWHYLYIGIASYIVLFVLDQASFTVFGALIARMGDAPLAASNAAISLMSTSFMPLVGISIATTTLVGQFIGAKELHHARKSGYTAIKIGIIYASLIASNFFIFPKLLISIVSKEPEVINLGAKILMLAGVFQLSDGFGICSNGALRGAGDTRFTMIIGLSYAWFLFLPLAYLFGHTLEGGVVGAWIGATIYIVVYGITVFVRFQRGKWESMTI